LDLDELIPIIGVGLLAVTTFVALVGAVAIGRARGLQDGSRQRQDDAETQARLDRMERQLDVMAGEIERLADVQRFALKVMGERLEAADAPKLAAGRVVTPH
jgi:hypothetical protein